ncbi:MAG: hypothetical protein ACREGG_01250 [Candidatus Saccharimonadales bacterium]
MTKKLVAVVAAVVVLGAASAAAAKACLPPSNTFYIDCHQYVVTDDPYAAYFYSAAADQGGFYVPTSELSEEVSEYGYGSDGDEYLPSEVEDHTGLTLVTVSLTSCAVPMAPPSNVHLIFSGGFNDNTTVFPVAQEVALLTSTSDRYDIGAAIKGATPTGINAFSVGGYGIVSTQDIPSGDVFTGQWLGEDGTVILSFPDMIYPAGATPNALALLVAGPDGTGIHPIFAPAGS